MTVCVCVCVTVCVCVCAYYGFQQSVCKYVVGLRGWVLIWRKLGEGAVSLLLDGAG